MPAPGCGLPGRATSAHHAWSSVATHPTRPMIARRPLVYPSTLLQSPSRHVRPPDVHAHLGWPRACDPSKTAKVIYSKATVLRPDPADAFRGRFFGHPKRLLTGSACAAGESGPRRPEHQKPSVAAGAARRGRFLGRRGAQPEGRCAQRTSSSFWPRLSERRERSERSEFCGPTLGRVARVTGVRSCFATSAGSGLVLQYRNARPDPHPFVTPTPCAISQCKT